MRQLVNKDFFDNSDICKKQMTVGNFCSEIVRGYNPNYVNLSKRPILNQKVNKGDVLEKQFYKYNSEDDSIPENKMAAFGDVLLNSLGQGTLGRVHLYEGQKSNVVIDQFITVLRTDLFAKSVFLAKYFESEAGKADILAHITGSTGMWVLSINNIRSMKIDVPEDTVFNKYNDFFINIYKIIDSNCKENEQLIRIRDGLLPKLMSGELDVSELSL